MLILNFESGTRFQDFRKNNHRFGLFSTLFSLEIHFLLANFLIECSRTTIRYRPERKIENCFFIRILYELSSQEKNINKY